MSADPQSRAPSRSGVTVLAVAMVAILAFLTLLPRFSPTANAHVPAVGAVASAAGVSPDWKGPAPISDEIDWSKVPAPPEPPVPTY